MIRSRAPALTLLLAAALPVPAVELNSANQAELEQLKAIGPSMSERLLQERSKAPFRDWSDLMARVPGMGARTAEKLSAQGATVQGQALPAERRR